MSIFDKIMTETCDKREKDIVLVYYTRGTYYP